MNNKTQTINTYNESAQALAHKFDNLGARVGDIEETFTLIQTDNPQVLEIGCGNGRDAQQILKHTNKYLGLDVSEKLIDLAKQKIPNAQFIVADIEEYIFPVDLDAVFAFASLIHVPKESLKKVFEAIWNSLNQGGAFRLSMKYHLQYIERTKTDEFGTRTYYLYSDKDILEMIHGFIVIKSEIVDLGKEMWVEFLFKK